MEQSLNTRDINVIEPASQRKYLGKMNDLKGNWNLVITNEQLKSHSHKSYGGMKTAESSNSVLVSAYHLNDKHSYSHISQNQFEKLRGFVVGYNSVASSLNPCYDAKMTCTHKPLSPENIDLHSYMLHVNGRLPLCAHHKKTKAKVSA